MNSRAVAAYTMALTAIAGVFVAIETWLAQNDLGTPQVQHWLKAIAAGVVPIGGAVAVAYFALIQLRAVYVNAGLNLAASGNMVDVHGNPLPVGDGVGTPPKPATPESAAQIVKDYSPNSGNI